MWDMLNSVDFGEYREILFSPDAPIVPQMMVFNGLVIVYLLIRWAANSPPLPSASRKTYKFIFVFINLVLLFQRDLHISEYLLMITPDFLRQMIDY